MKICIIDFMVFELNFLAIILKITDIDESWAL